MSQVVIWSTVAVVILFTIYTWIGAAYSRRIKGQEDFLLMGRQLGFWLFFGAYTGGVMGGSSVSGYVGLGYSGGLPQIWMYFSAILIILVFAVMFFRKLGVYGRTTDAYTIADFLTDRYGHKAKLPALIFAFMRPAFITGLQFISIGLVLQIGLGLPLNYGILVAAGVVLLYTILGGMYSAVVVQWLQAVFQSLGIIALLITSVLFHGGFGPAIEAVNTLLPSTFLNFWQIDGGQLLTFIISAGLFTLVDPWLWQWAFMVKDPQAATKAMLAVNFATPWSILSFLSGMLLVAGTKSGAIPIPPEIRPDAVYLYYVNNLLPTGMAVFMLVSFLSTVMSCSSSFVMNGATIIARDLYQGVINPSATPAQRLTWSRLGVLITTIFAAVTALWCPFLIPLWLLGQAIAVSGLLAPTMAAWFWKRATTAGALASMWSGGLASFVWALYVWKVTGSPGNVVHGLHPSHIGLSVSIIVLVVVSLCLPPDAKDAVDRTHFSKVPSVLAGK